MRKNSDLLVLSNLTYLIVGVIGLWLIGYYAIPVCIVAIISTLYHKNGEAKFGTLDVIFAYITIMCNCMLLYQDHQDVITISGSLTLVLSALAYFGFATKSNSKKYEFYHSLWHIVSGLATLMIFIGYSR